MNDRVLFSTLLVIFASASDVSAKHVRCWIGSAQDNHISPKEYDFCSSIYNLHGSVLMEGKHGPSPDLELFHDDKFFKRTRGCAFEIVDANSIQIRCVCSRNKCNIPLHGKTLLDSALNFAFIEAEKDSDEE